MSDEFNTPLSIHEQFQLEAMKRNILNCQNVEQLQMLCVSAFEHIAYMKATYTNLLKQGWLDDIKR